MTHTATINIELEITVEAGVDQSGFDVVSVRAVTGYDGARRTWLMSDHFRVENLEGLIQRHFADEAMTAIDEQVGEDRAAYLDGIADRDHERRMEAF